MRWKVIAIGLGLVLPLVAPGTAAAAPPVDREVWSDSWSFETDECGSGVSVEGRAHGSNHTRPVRGDEYDQAFLFAGGYHVRETVTSDETGRSFDVVENGRFMERTGTYLPGYEPPTDAVLPQDPVTGEPMDVSDFVYRFTAHEVVTVLVKASQGRPLYRARAVMRHEVVFDTLGDNEPGGFVIEESTTYVSGSDPWAGYDFCGFVATLATPALKGNRP